MCHRGFVGRKREERGRRVLHEDDLEDALEVVVRSGRRTRRFVGQTLFTRKVFGLKLSDFLDNLVIEDGALLTRADLKRESKEIVDYYKAIEAELFFAQQQQKKKR